MKKVFILTALLISILPLSGCGPVIGLIVDMFPKPDIPAQYKMNGKKVLVLVRSSSSEEVSPVFVHTISDQINAELKKNKAVLSTVDFTKVSDLMLNSSDVITAETAGKQLDVDIVLKIDMQNLTFDYRTADNCRVGQVLCFLTVLDAKTGKRLWPEDQLRKTLMINSKLEINSDDRLSASQIQRDLAKNSGATIAKLFYKHKAEK